MKTLVLDLGNGQTVTGSASEISEFLSLIDSGKELKFYNSSSRGRLLISKMDTSHIKNAILKMVRNWEESLRMTTDNAHVAEELMIGMYAEGNQEFDDLVEELATR